MKSDLLSRLLKEKPAHEGSKIDEALKRGYSMKQIMRALNPEMQTEERSGEIWCMCSRGQFHIPYTYESFKMLCRIFFD